MSWGGDWDFPSDSQYVYAQVKLQDRPHTYVGWIPCEFAEVGRKITIDSAPGDWTVMAVYNMQTGQDLHNHTAEHAEFARVLKRPKRRAQK